MKLTISNLLRLGGNKVTDEPWETIQISGPRSSIQRLREYLSESAHSEIATKDPQIVMSLSYFEDALRLAGLKITPIDNE
jgi:hypothetical protein